MCCYIEVGKQCMCFVMIWDDCVFFVFMLLFLIKCVMLFDVIKEVEDFIVQNDDECFDFDVIFMMGELVWMLIDLVDSFGGDQFDVV